jgi:hypothetical protein
MTAELCGIVLVNNPSLVSITESWLNSNIPYSAVAIGNNFNGVHRRDRPTPGGGVLVYVNRKYYVCTWLLNLEQNGKSFYGRYDLNPPAFQDRFHRNNWRTLPARTVCTMCSVSFH